MWYFKITSDPSKTFTLEPSETVQYFITLIPQKAGTYHIHSAMLKDDFYRIGPGQTVVIEGRDGITDGEFFGFYLPFFSSMVLIGFGIVVGVFGSHWDVYTKQIGSNSKNEVEIADFHFFTHLATSILITKIFAEIDFHNFFTTLKIVRLKNKIGFWGKKMRCIRF